MMLWLIFLLCHCQSVWNQRVTVDVQKCTQYKQEVFEIVQTFSYYFYGAPEVSFKTDDCKSYKPFIVDGEPASPKEFPLMARLGNYDELQPERGIDWFCGGTLISEKWVVTAAHCFRSIGGEVNRVRLGELVFDTDTDDAKPEDYDVVRVIEHTEYDIDNPTSYNDIGLVELSRNVRFSRYIHPACLPTSNGDEVKKFIAIGWGSKRFAEPPSKELLKVKLDYADNNRCSKIVSRTDNFPQGLNQTRQICADSRSRGDTCQGDSGGPLLAYHSYPCMYTLVGVTSQGFGCGTPNVPGIYTRVYAYNDWIRSIVWP